MVSRSWRLRLSDFSAPNPNQQQQADTESEAHKLGNRGWGMNDTSQTGHCSDDSCRNYYSSTSTNFCPTCQNNPKAECYSHRERCVTCSSKFVDLPGAECSDCFASRDEEFYKQLWKCKNCGEHDEGLDPKTNFCEACTKEYDHRDYCDYCGDFKYISNENYKCHDCENLNW